jgi:hypothetical protein
MVLHLWRTYQLTKYIRSFIMRLKAQALEPHPIYSVAVKRP